MSVAPQAPVSVVIRRSARSAVRVSLDRLAARHENYICRSGFGRHIGSWLLSRPNSHL